LRTNTGIPICSIKMADLANREELAKLAGKMGLRFCAEIGVFDGKYSRTICESVPDVTMICVDTWAPSRNHRDQFKLDQAYRHARMKLKYYQVVFMKMTSLEAAAKVPDNALDFVYIDAMHDYDNVKDDIEAWNPKVREGGILSGHDWGYKGVTKAVEEFAKANKVKQINLTGPDEINNMQSWWWIKNG
jgi:predicted O-methyltransferase YrrM